MRRYWHIKLNPKLTTGNEYNKLVAQYPIPNQLKIDFVHDVTKPEIKEVTREEFNKL